MGAHHRRDDPGAATERPTFDEVARGYDPRQVDDYLATLWRYASQVTSRAAAAEAALRHERERRAAEARTAQGGPTQAGNRIGMMLAIAEQEADEIVTSARLIAERALEEAIEDAAANHPIVREAREQADKLLLDAVEESRRLARDRHSDVEAQIARSTSSLDSLRHQQGEIIGAMLRLRSLVGSDDIDRAFADLAKAGAAPEPADEPPPTRRGATRQQPTSASHASSASSHGVPHAAAYPPPSPPPPPTTPPPGESSTRVRTSSAASGGTAGTAGTSNRSTPRAAPRHVHTDVVDAEPYVPEASEQHATAAYRPSSSRDDDIIDAEVVEE
jgi:cell division septum initiation protein DivIVA